MNNNRLNRYLLYALGEIFLVVIGILIALQINNWNEDRKEKQREIALLEELSNNLEKTRNAVNASLLGNTKSLEWNQYLSESIQANEAYHPKLDTILGQLPYWNTPYLTQNAYEHIETIGVDIISDPVLRKQIVELHEEVLPKLMNDWDRWEWDINQSVVMPFFAKHIRGSMSNRNLARPVDYEALKSNEEFLNILSVIYRTRIYGIGLLRESLVQIDQVKDEIDKSLARWN